MHGSCTLLRDLALSLQIRYVFVIPFCILMLSASMCIVRARLSAAKEANLRWENVFAQLESVFSNEVKLSCRMNILKVRGLLILLKTFQVIGCAWCLLMFLLGVSSVTSTNPDDVDRCTR